MWPEVLKTSVVSIKYFERHKGLAFRIALAPVFVALCYLYDWLWLRAATTSALVQLSTVLHVPMHREGMDLVELGGMRIQFVVACTMVDAFCGAIPLLWRTSLSLFRNLCYLFVIFVAVFLLNILRLETGFVALDYGVPWSMAHEAVAGVTYFCLLVFIVHERVWASEKIGVRAEKSGMPIETWC
jgi:hypothetical protein